MIYLLLTIAVLIIYAILGCKKPGIAIATSPLASFTFAISAVSFDIVDSDEIEALSLLTAILVVPVTITAIRFLSPSNETGGPWSKTVSVWIFRLVGYMVLLTVLTMLFNFFGFAMWFLFIIFISDYYTSHRRSVEMDIVSTIGACMRQNLPLPMALDTAAMSSPKKHAGIFRNISKWLTQGLPLSDAIRRGYLRCPAYILSSISAGQSLDQMPKAIAAVQAEIAEKSDDTKKIKTLEPLYPMIVISAVLSLTMGLMIFIIPVFVDVIDDFGLNAKLPLPTQITVDITNWLLGRKGVNALLAIGFPFLIIIGTKPLLRMLHILGNNQNTTQNPILSLVDFIKWHIPFMRWFEMNYSLIRVTSILRIGLLSGRPVNDAIDQASKLNINACYRRRLKRWLTCVLKGENISESALKCRISHSIAWAFDDQINSGNTPEILEMLESFYRENFSFKLNIARAVSGPLMILLLAVCVGFMAFAMFLPILQIITILTENAMP